MIQGYPTSHYSGIGRWPSGAGYGKFLFDFGFIRGNNLFIPPGENHSRYAYAHTATVRKLAKFEKLGR